MVTNETSPSGPRSARPPGGAASASRPCSWPKATGSLVGAVIVAEDTRSGHHDPARSSAPMWPVKRTGRTTQGVTLAKPDKGDEISIARNEEKDDPEDEAADEVSGETAQPGGGRRSGDGCGRDGRGRHRAVRRGR
ncbi:MAG: hypothetical protein ACLT4Y_07240 [Bifidobacterium breve]